MDQEKAYFDANKKLWNNKTPIHIDSEFYDNDSFLKGRNTLNEIELEYLKDIKGKKVLHIQCHFGQDSISLARMGAIVTATDISDKALEAARKFNTACKTNVTFIETDTYGINEHITEKFDLIFMTYGVVCWLPDLERLASIINNRLAPGGKVLCVEFHPMLFTFDFETDKIAFGYNNQHVYEEEITASYVEKAEEGQLNGKEYFWQHSLEEVTMPYINQGLRLTAFREFYYSPYNIFHTMKEIEKGKYRYGTFPYPIPHVYLTQFERV